MSDLFLGRKIFTDNSTIGKLTMGNLTVWTLEDTVRRIKIDGQTCIPSGVYKVEIRLSPHFQKVLPHILDVPYFEDVLIHSGNIPADTRGCILVGMDHPSSDFIGRSRDAFNLLFPRIEEESAKGNLYIHIAGGYSKEDMQMLKRLD